MCLNKKDFQLQKALIILNTLVNVLDSQKIQQSLSITKQIIKAIMSGWIKLHRKILESPTWTSEKFTRGQAWADLLLLANWEEGFIRVRGNRINLKRGQVGWSELSLSKRWKWSRTKTKNFIKELEKDQRIEQQRNRLSSVITIVNYNKYQDKEQQEEQQTVQQKSNRLYTNKEVKKNKNNKYTDVFESFWSDIPKRSGSSKSQSFKIWQNKRIGQDKELLNLINESIPKYKRAVKTKYYAKVETWLNQERWTAEYFTPKNNESRRA